MRGTGHQVTIFNELVDRTPPLCDSIHANHIWYCGSTPSRTAIEHVLSSDLEQERSPGRDMTHYLITILP